MQVIKTERVVVTLPMQHHAVRRRATATATSRRMCRSPCLRSVLINKKKQTIAWHGRARLRTTHKANELLTRAGVIANHAQQAAGGQRRSKHVHTA
jgi:hypothetical protein